jgi:FtsH-binding integral membrane protein
MSLHRVTRILVYELILGLAVALIAYASQSAQMTHRDSPIAVILFATASILLFTLPRVGGDSRLPHIVILVFGLTTLLAYLLGILLTG